MNLNEIELKNKKYQKEIQEIIIKKDKAEKEVEIEKSRTRYEKIKAEKTLMQLEEEKSVRYKSEKEFQGHKHGLKQKKDVYKTLLIGNGLLILIVSFFTAYSQKNVFNEMAKWFPDR